jgi:hypothetical protein
MRKRKQRFHVSPFTSDVNYMQLAGFGMPAILDAVFKGAVGKSW